MPKHTLIKRSAIAAALAFSLYAPTSHANYSQVIIFGDSLSDTGRLKDLVTQKNSAIGNALQPSFTTNPDPVWSSLFAQSYGKTANPNTPDNPTGTNYTVGGSQSARTATWADASGAVSVNIPTTNDQIKHYLTNTNGQTDPNALYAVWIGANDLFYAIEHANPSQVANAVRATATDIETLNQAGAKVILVPNIPDLSLTPLVQNHPVLSAQKGQVQLLTQMYNSGVFNALNGTTANVVPANTFALLQEAVANKEAFGFENANGVACHNKPNINPTSSSLACDENSLMAGATGENYMFADLIHPSGRTHRILAQYYQNIIDAPAQIASLPTQLIRTGSAKDRQLNRRMDTLDSHTHSLWADVSGSQDVDPIVTLGFDHAGQHRNTGFYLSHQEQDNHLGSTMSATTKAIGAGLYHRQNFGNVQLKANVGIDRLSIDTSRHIAWDGAPRTHTSEANGRRTHAGLQLGYQLGNSVTYHPYIGVNTQKVRIDDITESSPNLSTAMRFNKQTQKSLQGELGLDLQYSLNDKADLYGGVSFSREFNDDERIVTASLPSIREYTRGFNTPVKGEKDTQTHAHLGAKYRFGNANLNASISADHIDGDTDVGGLIGMQMKF